VFEGAGFRGERGAWGEGEVEGVVEESVWTKLMMTSTFPRKEAFTWCLSNFTT
jgi:hypothetical protein